MKEYIKKVKEYPEMHQRGMLTIDSIIINKSLLDCDFGIQIASDGRVWVCVNGIAFLRFKPKYENVKEKEIDLCKC